MNVAIDINVVALVVVAAVTVSVCPKDIQQVL